MALTVETGDGISGAEAYTSVAAIDAYWTKRQHTTFYTTWIAGSVAEKEGAAREASSFLDAVYGQYYRGHRAGYVQGLMWPRFGALDDSGFPLPDLPAEIVDAVCELAGRAISSRLAADDNIHGSIKRIREKVDIVETETEYANGAGLEAKYGAVAKMLAPVMNGAQPGASAGGWGWL